MNSDSAAKTAGPATLITVAPTGAESEKAAVPTLPVTLDELVTTAKECEAAGAAQIHIHIRDADARPTLDLGRLKETVHAVREATSLIVQLSTGGAVTDPYEHRLAVLDARPDGCSLTCGTVNFGDDVFMNRAADTIEMAQRIGKHGAVPELELYDAGHLDIVLDLLKAGHVKAPLHLQFVLGVKGALSASEANLEYLIERMTMLPSGCTWGVAGIGRHQLPMAELAAMWGGNARVGLEDNIYVDKGVLAEGSAPLVARAVELCAQHGRQVATVAQARALLGLPSRS